MGSKPIGISGSRAAAIIGLSQYSTPFTVWQEIMEKIHGEGWNAKRGYIYEPFEGNPATEFGSAFESAIIKLTEAATGDNIIDQEGEYSLDDQDYVTCHIDGMFKESGKMYEGKSCNHRAFSFSWGEPGTDRIPQTYAVQIQHNLMLTGATEATIGVLVFPKTVQEWADMGWTPIKDHEGTYTICGPNGAGDFRHPIEWAETLRDMGFFHQYHIEAKPDTQKILKELYEEFWGRYIIGDEVPDAVDYSDIKKIFTAPKGVLVVDEKQAELMREFKDVGKEIGKAGFLSKRRDFLKVQILKHVMENTTVADEDAVEKVVIMDESGNKLGSFNGKTYRS